MKIAILGSNGMLGSMLANYLSRDFEVLGTTRDTFDALNPDWRILDGCEWVINAIGIIPQRYADDKLMMKVNAVFPYALSLHARRVIQIATDCVYTGRSGKYTEDSDKDSIDIYGYSKALGEIDALNFINLRCSIIGLEPAGSYSLLKKFLTCPDHKFNGYINHLWNGVTTLAFARICQGIMQTKSVNVLPNMQHVIPADSVSKYKLLNMAGKYFSRSNFEVYPIQQGCGLVDRRLSTIRPEVNRLLWKLAGYDEIPTIEQMVKELAEYKVRVAV